MDRTLLLSATEAGAMLGISRSNFYKLKSEAKVPAPIRLGKRVLWRRKELEAWVAAGCPPRHEWDKMPQMTSEPSR